MKGEQLKRIRAYNGHTQESLAKALKVNRSYINALENERRTPSIAMLERIAAELNCSIKDFF